MKQYPNQPIVFPAISRDEKINRYKRMKELKERVRILSDEMKKIEKMQGKGEEEESMDRNWFIATIQMHIMVGLDDLVLLHAEWSILKEQKNVVEMDETETKDSDWKLDMPQSTGPLLSSDGQVLRPFILTSKRDEFKSQVFRPHWRLPTMTVDEYLQREMERGNVIYGTGEQSPEEQERRKGEEEEIEELVDQKTYKDRAWDDYKDDNPRGWGNRMNKG